jgi:phospholipase C
LNADGTPGPNFDLATQYQAENTELYSIHPGDKTAYNPMPPAMTDGTPTSASDTNPPPFATLEAAAAADHGILPEDLHELTTGASGLPHNAIDTRIGNATNLPSGPFPLTPSLSYDDYAASPVHRFYQMWQQVDCSFDQVTSANPSGCLNDLFPWVEVSVGAGSNGEAQPSAFSDQSTGEGSTSMGVYNVNNGDMPYFKYLADHYTLADNFH